MNSFAPWYPKRFELKITLVLPLSITFWSLHLVSKTSVWLFDLNFHDRRPLIPRKYRGPCIWVGGRRTHYLPQWRFSLSHLISHRSAHQHNSNLLLAFYDQWKKVWSTNTQSRFASLVFDGVLGPPGRSDESHWFAWMGFSNSKLNNWVSGQTDWFPGDSSVQFVDPAFDFLLHLLAHILHPCLSIILQHLKKWGSIEIISFRHFRVGFCSGT